MKLDPLSISSFLLRWRRTLTVGAATAAGSLLLASGAGQGADRLLRNMRDAVRSHPTSGEVHVVEIDARSIARIDRWPWPRGVHAQLIDRLREAGARTIAFDVDFSAASNPAEDRKLAGALERAGGSVVLATFRQQADSRSSDYIDAAPAKLFADKAFLGAVNVVPDRDGYIRNMPLGVETLGVPRPSLASLLAETAAEAGRSFEIDYSLDPASIPRHSVIDIIEGRVPASEIAGKRMLIGATAVEMGDRYAVPRYGVIPGVVIQALGAETLLDNGVPVRVGAGWSFLLALVLVAVIAGIQKRSRRVAGLGALGAMLLLLPLAAEALLALTIPVAAALGALAAAALVGGLAIFAERQREQILTDAATGLPNLPALELAAAGNGACVVVARIDRFAAIAAGLGPEGSAKLVQRVAERLRFSLSERTVYRVDEASLAWLGAATDSESVNQLFDSLAAMMRAPVECGRLVDVTLNFGVATAEAAGPAGQMVANAALAAHHAAQKGARWERFNDADRDETDWHLSLLGELEAAMAAGQLWNAYQPKLDIATGKVVAAEALVRWLHPRRGPIAPDSFIPIVEAHGRARELTTHVLGQAIEDALHWERHGHPIGVAVNVSATLLADHEFIEIVGQMLASSPLATSRITIEVTESAAMASPDRAIAALTSWRSLGVAISIDDYGTGQSSLGYLQKLPASELKIDKSFVQTVSSDERNAIMVRSTIALAHELGMKVVAEGIEDEACLAALAEMRCDVAQGYHISKPIPADMILEFLAERLPEAA